MPRSMGRSLPVIVVAVATSVAGIQAAGAAPDDDRVTSTRQISEDGSQADAAVAAAKKNAAKTKFGDKQQLIVTDALADSTGDTHVRMRRTYDELRVVGGDLVVHRSDAGTFTGSSQTLDQNVELDTQPSVTAAKALKRAGATADTSPEPQLVVDATGSAPKLAWVVATGGQQKDGTPSRLDTYVDAKKGTVLRSEQRIQTVDGDGDSLYGGTVPLQLTQSGSSFQLKDPTRGNTYTTDMNNRTDSALCTILGHRLPERHVVREPRHALRRRHDEQP